mgnify:FL=1
MEFASGGSVYNLVCNFTSLEERVIRKYTQQILEGLTHLHSQGIIHGYFFFYLQKSNSFFNSNLKSSNVLIDSNGVIKLSDVEGITGVKAIIAEEKPDQIMIPNSSSDSVYWTAPEVFFSP